MGRLTSWLLLSIALYSVCGTVVERRFRRDSPVAHGIRRHPESEQEQAKDNSEGVRRAPIASSLLKAIGPIAFGKKDDDDIKWDVPNFGNVGLGNGKTQILKFVPEGAEGQRANFGTWSLKDKPNLGYMEHDTTLGRSSGSSFRTNLGGLGSFVTENNNEKGTGLLGFSKALFPFLELPPPKSEEPDLRNRLTTEEQKLADFYYPKAQSYVDNIGREPVVPPTPFEKIDSTRVQAIEDDRSEGNPFDQIKNRPFYKRFRVHSAKTVEDADLVTKPDSPFKEDAGIKPKDIEDSAKDAEVAETGTLQPHQKAKVLGIAIPIKDLGLNDKQIYELCSKFAPVAEKHCYGNKVEQVYVERCRGYMNDCRRFQAEAKPLGAIANAFNSGVGLSYYNWGVNGIPFYPVNEEGGIGNGHHGKVDFGSWGGGYSDEIGVRDFWSQTQEYGANWYEGTYGYKRGWSIPLVESVGVEGGGGAQVVVPIKEGELGRPIQVTNGYSVGPYIGLADRATIDWYNGGVNVQRGFAVPFVGVGVTTGTGVGFPSIGTLMNKMALNGMADNMQIANTHQDIQTSFGLGASSDSQLSASAGKGTENVFGVQMTKNYNRM